MNLPIFIFLFDEQVGDQEPTENKEEIHTEKTIAKQGLFEEDVYSRLLNGCNIWMETVK